MPSTVDYFFAPHSPWTYLGHGRFVAMADAAQATVRLKPMDLGQVFPVSGGLPLSKRAPQRQAYRLVELARFARHLGLPLNLQPRFFPVQGDDAARLVLAIEDAHGAAPALQFAGRVMAAVWAQERNIA
ncbi:MAG: 2-hydroxychromene-2-carboxylate isomerase, partial [Comamonadaceae bacterium]